MLFRHFLQLFPQIRIICLPIGHQFPELDFSHLEKGQEEVHEGAGTGATWVEFVDLFAEVLFHWRVDYTTADWHHKVLIRRANQNVQSALFAGLIKVIYDFAALEPVCIVHDVIDNPIVISISIFIF